MNGILLSIVVIASLPDSTCVVCHSDLRQAYLESIHTDAGIGCTDCHGGRTGTLDQKKAHAGASYRGVPSRKEIPLLCAGCHSDPEKMHAYGLPIDQMAYYRSSYHGKLWKRGDLRAAVCTDCHGSHQILPPEDPKSPTNPLHIPETCARCHGDSTLMKRYGLSASIPQEYRESIHYQRIVEGQAQGPTCVTCHGSHSATPPGVEDVEKVCGSCHTRTAKAFTLSPHKEAFDRAGLPECAACHENHKIVVYTTENFLESCRECHEEGSEPLRVATQIQALLLNAENELEKAKNTYQEALDRGLPVEDLKARLEEGRSYLLSAYPLVHSLRMDSLKTPIRRAQSIADDVLSEIQHLQERRKEGRILLAVFWFYVLLTIGVVEAYRRSKEEP